MVAISQVIIPVNLHNDVAGQRKATLFASLSNRFFIKISRQCIAFCNTTSIPKDTAGALDFSLQLKFYIVSLKEIGISSRFTEIHKEFGVK